MKHGEKDARGMFWDAGAKQFRSIHHTEFSAKYNFFIRETHQRLGITQTALRLHPDFALLVAETKRLAAGDVLTYPKGNSHTRGALDRCNAVSSEVYKAAGGQKAFEALPWADRITCRQLAAAKRSPPVPGEISKPKPAPELPGANPDFDAHILAKTAFIEKTAETFDEPGCKPGYVYIAEAAHWGRAYAKIGQSERPMRRPNNTFNLPWEAVSITFRVWVPDCKALEKKVHERLAFRRVSGCREIFKTNPTFARMVILSELERMFG